MEMKRYLVEYTVRITGYAEVDGTSEKDALRNFYRGGGRDRGDRETVYETDANSITLIGELDQNGNVKGDV